MKMVKAYIRPEKKHEVLEALSSKGINGVTRVNVLGRGKQRGLKVNQTYYDELPKTMLMIVTDDDKKDEAVKSIARVCCSGKTGAFGDGKIFVLPVERDITISDYRE